MKQVNFIHSDFFCDSFKGRNFRCLAELRNVCIFMHLLSRTTTTISPWADNFFDPFRGQNIIWIFINLRVSTF